MATYGLSTTELMKTKLGEDFVKARDKAEAIKQHYRKNEIGEQEVIAWNPYRLKGKNPYVEVIAKAYDEMIERVIPKEAILSTRFQNWLTKEKNELMVDSKLNKDAYFKEQIDFSTGETTQNRGNDIIVAKMSYLNQKLSILEKSYKKHMKEKPEVAFASKEELEKWQKYYEAQKEKVLERLESGDFSSYNRTDKQGNILQEGTKEDAITHNQNIDNLISQVDRAREEQLQRMSGEKETQIDYVGDALEKTQRNRPRM